MRGTHFYADAPIAELYAWFADEAAPSSPVWEALCRWIATSEPMARRLDRLPGMKRQPNLFLAALRYLGGPVVGGDDFLAFVDATWDELEGVILTRSTQTNEPGRCATLLPALAAVPGPLAIIEVGCSAGLCLAPDRYGYEWATSSGVHELAPDAPATTLACRVDGPAPLPKTMPEIVWRAGIDLNPLDPANQDDAAWLTSLVWPGQEEREHRLRDCLTAVSSVPILRVRGDLIEELGPLVALAPRDATVVVFHSAVLAYLHRDKRAAFVELVSGLPVRWVSNEGQRVVPGVADRLADEAPPQSFVLSLDGEPRARAGAHGQWLNWLALSHGPRVR